MRYLYFNASDISSLIGVNPFTTINSMIRKTWEAENKDSFYAAQLQSEKILRAENKPENATLIGICGEAKTLRVYERELQQAHQQRGNSIISGLRVVMLTVFSYYCILIQIGILSIWFRLYHILFGYLTIIFYMVYYNKYTDFYLNLMAGLHQGVKQCKKLTKRFIPYLISTLAGIAIASEDAESSNLGKSALSIRNGNSKIQYLTFGPFSVLGEEEKWYVKIGGRFDGVVSATGGLIEAKTRVKKLAHKVYTSERVQATLYMRMAKVEQLTLVERYNEEIDEHLIEFDKDFFQLIRETVLEQALRLAKCLNGDPEMQHLILTTA
jgi:hypothetical protein